MNEDTGTGTNNSLSTGLRGTKRKAEVYECPTCGRSFEFSKSLKKHKCDGIFREQNSSGELLCSKGCGTYHKPCYLVKHETYCGADVWKYGTMIRCSRCQRQLKHHPRYHECDGIVREENSAGELLCLIGCGEHYKYHQIQRHEDMCARKGPVPVHLRGSGTCSTCGRYLVQLAGHKCDGIIREIDKAGHLLCLKGCGEYFKAANIATHEKSCEGSEVTVIKTYIHARKSPEDEKYGPDPRLQYKTYLEYCYANGKDHTGEVGVMPQAVVNTAQLNEVYKEFQDMKAGELEPFVPDMHELTNQDDEEDEGGTIKSYSRHYNTLFERNEAMLDFHNAEDFHQAENKCIGASWRHGKILCPDQARLTLHNARLDETRRDGATILRLGTVCTSCFNVSSNLNYWRRSSKITAEGKRLCSRGDCAAERLPGIMHCPAHKANNGGNGYRADTWSKRQQNEDRQNYTKSGSNIKTSDEMATFLAERRRNLPPGWTEIKKQIESKAGDNSYTNKREIFFVDCEFGGDRLYEVAVYSLTEDRLVIDTLIDYGITIDELQSDCTSSIAARMVRKIYPGEGSNLTGGTTLIQLAEKFEQVGINKDCVIVEWSTGFCDWHHLFYALSMVGKEELLPPKESCLRGITDLWKFVVPGCPSFALALLYEKVFPEERGLPHHRAGIDTLKMVKMVKKACGMCNYTAGV